MRNGSADLNSFKAGAAVRERLNACGRVPYGVTRIDVVRGDELRPGTSTRGIHRETAFDLRGATFARSRIAGGVSSDWHHHGDRELFGYIAAGRLRFEYGPKGSLAVELQVGDFFRIPPRLIHRDVNPTRDEEAMVVNLLTGTGPVVAVVPGPED